jgi:hypothetical protein
MTGGAASQVELSQSFPARYETASDDNARREIFMMTRATPNREHAGESTQSATARRRNRVRDREAGDSTVPPVKKPGGPVAARHRSGWLTLETDQGVTVTVKFVLVPALNHLVVFEDV